MASRKDIKKAGYRKVPASDPDLEYCLTLTGISGLDGKIYVRANPEYNASGSGMVAGQPVILVNFTPGDSGDHRAHRWAFATGIGYIVHGKRFGYDAEAYERARHISDTTFAGFAKYYDDESWDPRDYNLQELAEHLHKPVKILSAIWNHVGKLQDLEKRQHIAELVRSVWENDFGVDDMEKCLEFVSSQK